jgi:hypothetical protein
MFTLNFCFRFSIFLNPPPFIPKRNSEDSNSKEFAKAFRHNFVRLGIKDKESMGETLKEAYQQLKAQYEESKEDINKLLKDPNFWCFQTMKTMISEKTLSSRVQKSQSFIHLAL